MKAKHKLDFEFWPLKIQFIPWLRYFALWIFTIAFSEGHGGWMLFGITINEFRGIKKEKTALTLTLFGHNFRFGVKDYLVDTLFWREHDDG